MNRLDTILAEELGPQLKLLMETASVKHGFHIHACTVFFIADEKKADISEFGVITTFGQRPEGLEMCHDVLGQAMIEGSWHDRAH